MKNNIDDYRIVENAIDGFSIEKKQLDWGLFNGWFFTKPKYYWDGIGNGRKFGRIYFKTKEDAIEYLEKLCTPDVFYYPNSYNPCAN